jgi:hypothetical protein
MLGSSFEFLMNCWFQFFKYSRIKESSVVSKAFKELMTVLWRGL